MALSDRDSSLDASTRGGSNSGTSWGTIWGALGVLATVVIGVLPFVWGSGNPSSTPSVTSTVPAPTVPPSDSYIPSSDAPEPPPRSNEPVPPSPPRPVVPSVSGPSILISPAAVARGDEMVIRGSGFDPLTGVHIRWFSTESISYELGRNVPVEESGSFAAGGPMENPGFCGAGVIAVFSESGSSYTVPDFSEALATARVIMRC